MAKRNFNKPTVHRTSTRSQEGRSARRKMTGSYHVIWEIELDAESLLSAAETALEIMQDPGSLARCFTVTSGGQRYFIDLNADDASATVLNLKTN